MDKPVLRSVKAGSEEISFLLERKNVKNLNLRIRYDGGIYVSANVGVPVESVDEFVIKKSEYIKKASGRFKRFAELGDTSKQYISGETVYLLGRGLRLKVVKATETKVFTDGVYIYVETKIPEDFEAKKRLVSRFIDSECKRVFTEILDELYPIVEKYGVNRPQLRVRNMKTRWGSCLPEKGIVTINRRLIEFPRNCIEYVIMHELCHFVHPNHSKEYYGFLGSLMPDWRERKEWLENRYLK